MNWNNRYENEKTANIGQAVQHVLNSGVDAVKDVAHYVLRGMAHPFQDRWDPGTSYQQGVDLANQVPSIDYDPTLSTYVNTHSHDAQGLIGAGADAVGLAAAGLGARGLINKAKEFIGYEPGTATGVARAGLGHAVNKVVNRTDMGYPELREKLVADSIERNKNK